MTATFTETEQNLLGALQTEFPVCERPYAAIGLEIGLEESAAIDHTKRLRESGLIRQISAIFDTRKLGYTSALVAAILPPERLEEGAAVVSAHPGVSHNYEREHDFNLWFTLAVPPGKDFDEELEDLSRRARFVKCRPLPSIKVFRIGVRFNLGGERSRLKEAASVNGKASSPLTEFDIRIIRELQEDLPVEPTPYAEMCKRLGLSIDELAAWAKGMQEQGRLRRISAVIRHRQAGYTANAMVVWEVVKDKVQEMGEFCADIDEVSHCYKRPTFDDWPYSLYTMIHGKEPADCDRVIAQVVDRFGDVNRAILYSTREFKKERVKYFV